MINPNDATRRQVIIENYIHGRNWTSQGLADVINDYQSVYGTIPYEVFMEIGRECFYIGKECQEHGHPYNCAIKTGLNPYKNRVLSNMCERHLEIMA